MSETLQVNVFAPKYGSRAGLSRMLEAFGAAHRVPVGALTGPGRNQVIAHLRQRFMWEAYQTGDYSLFTIAGLLNRDHTTVLHGIRAHEARLAQ